MPGWIRTNPTKQKNLILFTSKSIRVRVAYKTGDNYAKVQTFIRCKLSFIIIRSALLCLRGSRTLKASNLVNIDSDFNLNCDKVKL